MGSEYMNTTPYLEYLQQQTCLPDRAVPHLVELVDEDLSQDEFTDGLHQLADNFYYQEPDHPRYDADRCRFPYPNEADLQSAREYQAANPADFAA